MAQRIVMTIIRDDDHTWATDAENQLVAAVDNGEYVNRDAAIEDVARLAVENMRRNGSRH